jgi:hypothetical protein
MTTESVGGYYTHTSAIRTYYDSGSEVHKNNTPDLLTISELLSENHATLYDAASAKLEYLLTTETEKWSSIKDSALLLLRESIETSASDLKRYKSLILHEAAPLFTLPQLHGTIEENVYKQGIRQIRKSYTDIGKSIATDIKKGEFSYEEKGELIGLANELAVLTGLTDYDVATRYVPRPALPWEDRHRANRIAPTLQLVGTENINYDIALTPLVENSSIKKLQIKTNSANGKEYASDISVLITRDIADKLLLLQPKEPRETENPKFLFNYIFTANSEYNAKNRAWLTSILMHDLDLIH